jgi:hypothetical protein
MDAETITDAVSMMPQDFRRLGNMSMLGLLRASGYLTCPEAITEELLERAFVAQPERIDAWVLLSEDKRTSEGWYIRPPRACYIGATWEVGYHPNGPRQTFPGAARACAFFVKREAEDLRSYIAKVKE